MYGFGTCVRRIPFQPLCILTRWHERFQHPADNERVNQPFLPVQLAGLYAGDDNGMVLRRILCPGHTFPCRKVNHTGILAEILAGQQLFHNRR